VLLSEVASLKKEISKEEWELVLLRREMEKTMGAIRENMSKMSGAIFKLPDTTLVTSGITGRSCFEEKNGKG
jgi:hypothetical protein